MTAGSNISQEEVRMEGIEDDNWETHVYFTLSNLLIDLTAYFQQDSSKCYDCN